MKKAIKKEAKVIEAYQLGSGDPQITKLIEEGKIKEIMPGRFEVFSKECTSGIGLKAFDGYYVKIDKEGYPYPIEDDWFEMHHKLVDGSWREIQAPMSYWEAGDAMCEEIQFLINSNQLSINEGNNKHYFVARINGAELASAKDAVIVIYSCLREEDGKISNIDFFPVDRATFDKLYTPYND